MHARIAVIMQPKLFQKGDKIEVRLQDDSLIWYPATFLRASHNQVYLELETLSETEDTTSPLRREYVSAGDVRPSPQPEIHRYFKVGEQVEGFCRAKMGWREGHVMEILENSRYTVSFEGDGRKGSLAEMEHWELRAVREWTDGSWFPPFLLQEVPQNKPAGPEVKSRGLILKVKRSRKAPETNFNEGMLIEVTTDEEGFRGSWFTAVIVKPLRNDKFLVEYRTLKTEDMTEFLREEVDISRIRHFPPIIQRAKPFHYLENVDAWYNEGWWEGHIVGVIDRYKYMVHFVNADEEMVFEHWKLRPHQVWIDGKWFAAPKVNLTDVNLKSNKVNLKRKRSQRASGPTFRDGMMVEVKSDEEGFQGSLAFELQVNLIDVNLKSNKVNLKRKRSQTASDPTFRDGMMVEVKSDEEGCQGSLAFELQVNWTDVNLKSNKVNLKRKRSQRASDPTFRDGMMVEVKSDEEGYQGSWYTAMIVCCMSCDKFLVEYQTLKTDDESALLREESLASYIRPCPPKIVPKDCFKMLEEVDVWYNDGWWVGLVSRVLDGLKYAVYFWTTNEELIVDHFNLRPHQEWIGGKWIVLSRKKSKFLMKNSPGKYRSENDGITGTRFYEWNESTNETLEFHHLELRPHQDWINGQWVSAKRGLNSR